MIYTVTDWLTARLFEYIHSMKMFRLKQFYTIYSKYVIKHSKLLLYLRKSFTDLPISIYICFKLLLSSIYCNRSYWKARTEGWLEAERSLPSWLVDFPTWEAFLWKGQLRSCRLHNISWRCPEKQFLLLLTSYTRLSWSTCSSCPSGWGGTRAPWCCSRSCASGCGGSSPWDLLCNTII